ncbi:MAG: hypothetical protein HOU81_12160 [Hamadaea sp.]|uniref:hypothetical protein n=1 Tax=Hamadaea sp. TaxID=2024425 RepID=UPI0017E8E6D9|nr:hypothetical protein [Hamadaea sp.]NUR71565.1 hypothetical protein [Hamadaea sp.]NUT17906.1 hypothetical protein [Hamadaea sp.]
MKDEYLLAQVQRLLAEDGGELGIDALRRDDTLVLRGEVESADRCREVERRVADAFPELTILNELTVPRVHKPQESEELTGRPAAAGATSEDRH